jgi:hypothetical protein
VPITDGEIAIGALVVGDDQPWHFESEELALLESLGRGNSAALGGSDEAAEPFWTPSGLISRAGLRTLLSLELARTERTRAPLCVLAFESADDSWRPEVFARLSKARSAVGALDGNRYAVALMRETFELALEAIGDVIQSVRRSSGLRGAGVVVLAGGNVALRTGEDLLSLAEDLCGRAVRRGGGEIERLIVRHDEWQEAPAAGR